MNMFKFIYKSETLRKLTPTWLTFFIRRHFSVLAYDQYIWAQSNPFSNEQLFSSYESNSPYTLGIIKEFAHEHIQYIAACRELEIPYKILDISGTDWIRIVQESGCDAFLVRPSAVLSIWKQMYDERLKVMVDDLGKIIYPTYNEIWIYESKRRMRDWLIAHNIPHPRTDIFYDVEQAINFITNADLPIVIKTNHGASSRGVHILRNKRQAMKIIRQSFRKGILVERGDMRDRHWGNVILQEYIPDVKEWRLVRIGDSYFGHPKGKVGDFHSGSTKVLWDAPSIKLLQFVKHVTDTGNFRSMNVDVFETKDGEYFVNELQTVFGASYSKDQLRINGKAGRYIYNENNDTWIFQEGDFARNACANLRVEHLIKILNESRGIRG